MSQCLENCTNAHGLPVDGFVECSALDGQWVKVDTVINCTDYQFHTVTEAAECREFVQEAISRAGDPDPATSGHARKAASASRLKRMGKMRQPAND